MTDEQVKWFEMGFAAYADGVLLDEPPASVWTSAALRWWRKGWRASERTNRAVFENIGIMTQK